MKPLLALLLLYTNLPAHDLLPMEREELRSHLVEEWKRGRLELASSGPTLPLAAAAVTNAANAPATAKAFLPFTKLDLRAEGGFLYVGSNGLPDHSMMVGITAWQQQVPLPQSYFGTNAWRIPLTPVPANEPAMIKGRFLRGAIALAVNGVPIFNPQNNRGEISQEIGELDQWGGHCGRADDYHYHIVPLHLEAQAGKGMPLAYALDGYPIYGLTEPDGSMVGKLDECHGHDLPGVGYHYHASTKYPYVIGGFRGEVVERQEQVDPQPRARGVRPASTPLRGATITGFESLGKDGYKLSYEVNGEARSVSYAIQNDGSYPFEYDNGREGKVKEVYRARQAGGTGPPTGPRANMNGDDAERAAGSRVPLSPSAARGGPDGNGDGIVTAQELAGHTKMNAAKSGSSLTDAMLKAKTVFLELDKDRNGQLEAGEWQGHLINPAPPIPEAGQDRSAGGRESQERGQGGTPMRKGGGGGREAFVERADQPRSSDGKFLLSSPVMEDMTEMPVAYTGAGEGATLPLDWKGAPMGTKGYALIMDHADREGNMKWYWTLYDLPADASSLPKNAQGIGRRGTGFKGEIGYEPPTSRGPGAKVYVVTLYALSAPLDVDRAPGREELLIAMKGKVMASSSLRVIHSSQGGSAASGGVGADRPRPATVSVATSDPPEKTPASMPGAEPGRLGPPNNRINPTGGKEKGAGKGGAAGLIKPSIADTVKLNVYADNWFMLYVNGRLVAVDPIQFTPHNVVSVDFLPEYPLTIAVLAKDNADPKTGLEYGTSIGDGGFVLKFADGTVTNAEWKAKNFFHSPAEGNRVDQEALPLNWWATDFDDSAWANAKEYSIERVDPKQPFFDHDFDGAKFIWTDDLALDNTVIFRMKVEKPGWKPRWDTKPDLDVTGAPQQ